MSCYSRDPETEMFIREQMMRTIYDMRAEFRDDEELLDIYVWSPISCRYTNWTFRPKLWKHKFT